MAGALLAGEGEDGGEGTAAARAAGLSMHALCAQSESLSLPSPSTTAARIAALLGLNGAVEDDDSTVDLVLLQTPPPPAVARPDGGEGEPTPASSVAAAAATLAWVDALLGALARGFPSVRSGLIIGVILGGGEEEEEGGGGDGGRAPPPAVPLPRLGGGLVPCGGGGGAPPLPPIARPSQTWELACGGGPGTPTAPAARSLYLAARCPGVVRTDGLARVDPAGAATGGALGATALAHLLPELAYKMGRAPKYGA